MWEAQVQVQMDQWSGTWAQVRRPKITTSSCEGAEVHTEIQFHREMNERKTRKSVSVVQHMTTSKLPFMLSRWARKQWMERVSAVVVYSHHWHLQYGDDGAQSQGVKFLQTHTQIRFHHLWRHYIVLHSFPGDLIITTLTLVSTLKFNDLH